ncbi:Atp11p [Ascoidea rubescens DSM 1968]|uniref:ATP11-domain-containing protein n=1 Tax=Ascoidea rubescens DSM 1968 TaxID=1344418 RepID=A0A1D2VPK6_9ASCO|nr:ATP11-domain-containing protein [Ascoidea rubescens DSM 1968]ODV63529.1 ATP11-domain-containing protein [Ascoidea rubescens DSM 1968]
MNSFINELFLNKYKEKLLEKAKKVGAGDISQLKEKLKDEIEEKKSEFSKIDPLKELDNYLSKNQNTAHDPKIIKINKPLDQKKIDSEKLNKKPYKTLNSYIDVEKVSNLKREEIEFIWNSRFMNKENTLIAATDLETFNIMLSNAKKNPIFLLPLPKDGVSDIANSNSNKPHKNHELHLIQWIFSEKFTTHCIITTLAEYKLNKEFSRPHTTLTFHSELADSKDIILINGLVESENIKLPEAQYLVLNVQKFYGGLKNSVEPNKRRLKLLNDFTSGSSEFNLQDLINESDIHS